MIEKRGEKDSLTEEKMANLTEENDRSTNEKTLRTVTLETEIKKTNAKDVETRKEEETKEGTETVTLETNLHHWLHQLPQCHMVSVSIFCKAPATKAPTANSRTLRLKPHQGQPPQLLRKQDPVSVRFF